MLSKLFSSTFRLFLSEIISSQNTQVNRAGPWKYLGRDVVERQTRLLHLLAANTGPTIRLATPRLHSVLYLIRRNLLQDVCSFCCFLVRQSSTLVTAFKHRTLLICHTRPWNISATATITRNRQLHKYLIFINLSPKVIPILSEDSKKGRLPHTQATSEHWAAHSRTENLARFTTRLTVYTRWTTDLNLYRVFYSSSFSQAKKLEILVRVQHYDVKITSNSLRSASRVQLRIPPVYLLT